MTEIVKSGEASVSLEDIIIRLSATCESNDKEIYALSDALTAALECLKNDPVSLSKVASVAKDSLGEDLHDIRFFNQESYISILEDYAESPNTNTFELRFDINVASVVQMVLIVDDSYDEDSIVSGLQSGELVTTTWFGGEADKAIRELSTGNVIAKIMSQEVDGEYSEFR